MQTSFAQMSSSVQTRPQYNNGIYIEGEGGGRGRGVMVLKNVRENEER